MMYVKPRRSQKHQQGLLIRLSWKHIKKKEQEEEEKAAAGWVINDDSSSFYYYYYYLSKYRGKKEGLIVFLVV